MGQANIQELCSSYPLSPGRELDGIVLKHSGELHYGFIMTSSLFSLYIRHSDEFMQEA